MGSLSSADTGRLRRPSWKDPRLLVGVLLVLSSVAGVVALVRAAETRTTVYAAREDIDVGDVVALEDIVAVEVRLGEVEGRYLREPTEIRDRVAMQRVAKGDLVPLSSLGSADRLGRRPVSINVTDSLPASVVAGARVDVWVALPDGRNGYAEPRLLVPTAEVAHVESSSSALGGQRETVVHVLVDPQQLPALLGAQANKAKVSLVWNPGGRPS
jgi:hypothetical protein